MEMPDSVANGIPKNKAVTQDSKIPLGESPNKVAIGFHIVESWANPNKRRVKYANILTTGGIDSLDAAARVDGSNSVTNRRTFMKKI